MGSGLHPPLTLLPSLVVFWFAGQGNPLGTWNIPFPYIRKYIRSNPPSLPSLVASLPLARGLVSSCA